MTTLNPTSLGDLLVHAAWARRLAGRLLRQGDADADDLLQDTWLAVGEQPPPPRVAPRQWLAGVVRNLARMDLRSADRRRQRHRTAGALVQGQAAERPDAIAERVETQRLLAGLVLALPPIYRDVVLLRYYDDLSTDEVAARLDIPPGTARRRLTMALAQLRGELEAKAGKGEGDWRRAFVALVGSPAAVLPRSGGGSAPIIGTAALALLVGAVALLPKGPAPGGGPAVAAMASGVASERARPTPPTLIAAASRPGEAPATAAASSAPVSGGAAAMTSTAAASVERYQVPLGTGPIQGPADAKLTILEFVDYQCPFTTRAEKEVRRLLERYAGQVRFQVIHRPLEFHPEAELLARATLAADAQGKFWPMHARLMDGARERWTPEALAHAAQDLALDVPRFKKDLESQATRTRLAVDEATAASLGIDGVPMFFVNGRLLTGAGAPSQMPEVIAEELARAESLLASGVRPADLYNTLIASGTPVPPRSRLREPSPPSPDRPRPTYESIFTSSATCAAPHDAPTALDFSLEEVAQKNGEKTARSAWSLSVANLDRYETHISRRARTLTLRSTTAEPTDFVAYQQSVLAGAYRGKNVRFRAQVQGRDLTTWAGLWLRVERADGTILTSERTPMQTAERDWHPAEVTIAIPADAHTFSFGLLLAGKGTAAMRNLTVEAVGR